MYQRYGRTTSKCDFIRMSSHECSTNKHPLLTPHQGVIWVGGPHSLIGMSILLYQVTYKVLWYIGYAVVLVLLTALVMRPPDQGCV